MKFVALKFAALTAALFFTTFMASVSMAISHSASGQLRTQMIGRVNLQKNYQVTCLAINCPAAAPYFELILDDVQVNGIGPVEFVTLQDFPRIEGLEEAPTVVTYGGVNLKNGSYVIIEAEVHWAMYQNKVVATALNPTKVTLAPARHPYIVY